MDVQQMTDLSAYVIRNCSIAFKCQQTWESMDEQEVPSVRHCRQCDRPVFQCKSVRQLKSALEANACIAAPMKLFAAGQNFVGLVVKK